MVAVNWRSTDGGLSPEMGFPLAFDKKYKPLLTDRDY